MNQSEQAIWKTTSLAPWLWSPKKTTRLTLQVRQIKYGREQADQDHGFYSSLTNSIWLVYLKQHTTGRKGIFQTHCGTVQHTKLEQHATDHLSHNSLIHKKTGQGRLRWVGVFLFVGWLGFLVFFFLRFFQLTNDLNGQTSELTSALTALYCGIQGVPSCSRICGLLRACTVHRAAAGITQSAV